MRAKIRLIAAPVLAIAVLAPLGAHANDGTAAPTVLRNGNCKYGTANGTDRGLQICAKVTIYLLTGQAQSRHVVSFAGKDQPGGSYQLSLSKTSADKSVTSLLNATYTFSPGSGGFTVERMSNLAGGALAGDAKYTATTRVTIGSGSSAHAEVVSMECAYPDPDTADQVNCLGTSPGNPY